MIRYIPCLLCLFPLVVSAKEPDAESLAREVSHYLDDQALAIVHVDLSRLELEPAFKQLLKLGAPKEQIEEARRNAKTMIDNLKGSGIKRGFAVISLADLPENAPLVVLPLEEDAKAAGAVKLLAELAGFHTFEKDGYLIAGKERVIQRVRNLKPPAHPELVRAFAGAPSSAVHVIVMPNENLRRAFAELVPTLPRELGGGSTAFLSRGLRWFSLSGGVAPTASISLTVQTSNEASAKELRGLIENALKIIGQDKEVQEFLPDFAKVSALLLPKVNGDRLELNLKEEQVTTLLVPVLQRVREAARRMEDMNHLRQIGLAFHTYLDKNGTFPAYASFDKQDNPLLSWRVHVLPFLGEEKLYAQFKLDEPWDSEHNKKLIKRMPKIFHPANAELVAAGRTTYVIPTGPGTSFNGKVGLKIAQITDGTSNTIMALETDDENAVVWTKPADLRIDPKNPAKGLRRHQNKQLMALFMDGSAQFLPANINAKNLWAMITPDGGEVIER
jgi:hypothetical protein